MPAGGAEIDAAFIERVDGHRLAQNVHITVVLRQAFGKRLPLVSASPAAVDAQFAIGRKVLRVALDWNDVDGLRLVGVNLDHEPEVCGQVAADFLPRVAGVVAAHHIPVLLHEQHTRARSGHRDAVNAVADVGIRVGDVLGLQSTVDRLPRLTGVVAPEHARSRDGDEDPAAVARIQKDSVQAHATGTWLPAGSRAMAAQPGQFVPCLSAVSRAEQRGVFNSSVDGVRIGERRFEMPGSLKLPRAGRAVVPLVSAGDAVIHEFVAHCLPSLATIIGALNQLPEPTAVLRRIEPIQVCWRSLEMVDLPAGKVGAGDLPPFARRIRSQNECALARPDQYSYTAHLSLFPEPRAGLRSILVMDANSFLDLLIQTEDVRPWRRLPGR